MLFCITIFGICIRACIRNHNNRYEYKPWDDDSQPTAPPGDYYTQSPIIDTTVIQPQYTTPSEYISVPIAQNPQYFVNTY